MFEDTYKILVEEGDGLYKEKGSKFIAKAFAVHSEDEVKAALSSLGELLLLESCPLSLSEIFNAEIGEGDERIEGIFE